MTPTRLCWLYNTFYYVPTATDQNTVRVAGWLDEYLGTADLMKFMWEFCQTTDVNYTVERANGSRYDPWHPTHEANLGMQYTQSITYPTPLIYYSTGRNRDFDPSMEQPTSDNWLFAWLTYVLDQKKILQTIGAPYGIPAPQVPPDYATTLCTLFLKFAGHGVSVLFSSGNYRVGAGDCKDDFRKVLFSPYFPALCTYDVLSPFQQYKNAGTSPSCLPHCRSFAGPWVASIGGTRGIVPKVMAEFSAGGLSIHFSCPDYQEVAVPPFLQRLGNQYKGLYKCVFCHDLTLPILT